MTEERREPYGWALGPRTDPDLLARLIERARQHKMTPEEIRAQRVSFVYGQMNGNLSKEEVRAILAEHNGWPDDDR